jgi:hypothetical protein
MRAASVSRFSPMSFSTYWSWLVNSWARMVELLMAVDSTKKDL